MARFLLTNMETFFKILGFNVLISSKYGGFSKIFNSIIIGLDNFVLSLRVCPFIASRRSFKIKEEMRSLSEHDEESPDLLRLHLQFAPFLAMTVF